MLKLRKTCKRPPVFRPAAFRRLCVETLQSAQNLLMGLPAAFRRLCVETKSLPIRPHGLAAAAFRRLCVETKKNAGRKKINEQPPSGGCVLKPRLCRAFTLFQTAAFRRLCVETAICSMMISGRVQPPSGGCVLKLLVGLAFNLGGASRLQAAVC